MRLQTATGRRGTLLQNSEGMGEDHIGNRASASLIRTPGGTPPQKWRRHVNKSFAAFEFRNTSTRVEKTCIRWAKTTHSKKHLHMRGEGLFGDSDRDPILETPPHAWRRQKMTVFGPVVFRNTSTCVEKTSAQSNGQRPARKHLHVRGEDAQRFSKDHLVIETPPRAWRRPVSVGSSGIKDRNTSTCVEKTAPGRQPGASARKHLHVRGEDGLLGFACATRIETPPRAWRRP